MATRHPAARSRSRSHAPARPHSGKRSTKAGNHPLRLIGRAKRPETRRRTRLANLGAVGAGIAGVTAASFTGVGELTVGLLAAYVAYRVIRYGVAPTEALIEGVELEHGKAPENEANVA